MRVIAGSARRLPLKTPAGMNTRPTTDRIKETLFNILQPQLYGCRFLDLFAGSGGIGIEALSRGAEYAVFVDNSREAVACIRDNLAFTHLQDKAAVIAQDCIGAIGRLASKRERFDLIFIDPPYQAGLEYDVLKALRGTSLVDQDTVIIIEVSLENDLPFAGECGFCVDRVKKYKSNKHLFLSQETY